MLCKYEHVWTLGGRARLQVRGKYHAGRHRVPKGRVPQFSVHRRIFDFSHLRFFCHCVRRRCESNLEQADKAGQRGVTGEHIAKLIPTLPTSIRKNSLPIRHRHWDVVQIVVAHSRECTSDRLQWVPVTRPRVYLSWLRGRSRSKLWPTVFV